MASSKVSSSVGSRLREERERVGLSQAALGKLGGVAPQTQLRFEAGTRSPDADYLAAVAVNGIDISYVITGTRKGAGVTVDVARLADAIAAVEIILARKRMKLSAARKGQVVALVFEHGPSEIVAEKYIKLLAG